MPSRKPQLLDDLKLIAEYRVLTSSMLKFLWSCPIRTAHHRISSLAKELYINQNSQQKSTGRGRRQNLIEIGPSGIEVIAESLTSKDKEAFYSTINNEIHHKDHELLTNLFRIHLLQLSRQNTAFLTEFISPNTPFLPKGKTGSPLIAQQVEINGSSRSFVPDGVFMVEHMKRDQRLLFFLESDRANEPLNGEASSATLQKKFENYHKYLVSGNYKRYEKKWHCSFKGFRLLVLCNETTRMRQISRFISQYPTLDYVWITDVTQLMNHGIGAKIWLFGGNASIPLQSILGSEFACDLPPVY